MGNRNNAKKDYKCAWQSAQFWERGASAPQDELWQCADSATKVGADLRADRICWQIRVTALRSARSSAPTQYAWQCTDSATITVL